jgi:phage terminase large subunit-like protein
MKPKTDAVREIVEADFEAFIRLVQPGRVLGSVHSELCSWLTREEKKKFQLVLMPRDHMKSAISGLYVAWRIVRNPAVRILYLSSTSNLASKQLKFIKDILTSKVVQKYWPELINPEEGKREKWTEAEIAVDHPRRKAEYIRDPTVWAAGLTTSITGMHADLIVGDDIVVEDNADTEDGRAKVRKQYSYLASIGGAESEQLFVGTRYNPQDLYHSLLEAEIEDYDEYGDLVSTERLYEVFERQVEDRGDGTGQFLWPRQRTKDGREFGFDAKILARKRAQYLDLGAFYAQYYNDPNHVSAGGVPRESFQYYDKTFLSRSNGQWYFKQSRLNVFASIDFAFSLARRSDYTAIAVIGVDANNNYYILEIARFKTDQISEYFKEILQLHRKWDFRKLRAEVTAAQDVIVKSLKQDYIRPHGLALSIDDYRPTRNEGTKAERISSILRPRYDNHQIWHYQGGNCQILEDELVVLKPPHDDCKDALAAAIDVAQAPARQFSNPMGQATIYTHSKFGGVA